MEERTIRLRYHHVESFLADLLGRKNHLADMGKFNVYGQEMVNRYGRLLESVTDETPLLIVPAIDSVCEGCPKERPSCHKPEETLDELMQSFRFKLMTPEQQKWDLEYRWELQLEVGRTYTVGELKSRYLEWRKKKGYNWSLGKMEIAEPTP